MLTPGQIVPLTIDKPAAGGRMIARVDGQVVLVGGAIPGERVRGRIARVALPGAVAVARSPEEAYRMRARLHGRGGQLGFFREGTHELCDARQTRQLRPDTCDTLDRLAAALRSLGVASVRGLELA